MMGLLYARNWRFNDLSINYIFYLSAICPLYVKTIVFDNLGFNIYVDKKYLLNVVSILKLHFNFYCASLLDIFAIDRPFLNDRFKLTYVFLSYKWCFRFFLHTILSKNDFVDSLYYLYKSSNWLEREVWDMFGIFFFNHPDLRRILTDYGFTGFPLRKDFPISGYLQFYYDESLKKVSSEPLKLTQNYRSFFYNNPWV